VTWGVPSFSSFSFLSFFARNFDGAGTECDVEIVAEGIAELEDADADADAEERR
jgi:hypothetical protein